jgi:hypothetical protein
MKPRSMTRLALAVGALATALLACAPRNKPGDVLLGQDSLTNGRASVSGGSPKSSP